MGLFPRFLLPLRCLSSLSAFGLLIFLPGRSSLLSHAANFSYFRFCPRISVVIYLVPVSTVPLGTRFFFSAEIFEISPQTGFIG
jgi:hypothetical protein